MKTRISIFIAALSLVTVGVVYLVKLDWKTTFPRFEPSYDMDTTFTSKCGLNLLKNQIENDLKLKATYYYQHDSISVYQYKDSTSITIIKNANFTKESIANILYSGYATNYLNLDPVALIEHIWRDSTFISFNPNKGAGDQLIFKISPSTKVAEIKNVNYLRQFSITGDFISISTGNSIGFLNLTLNKKGAKEELLFKQLCDTVYLIIIAQDSNDPKNYATELLN
ncbi:MAG TPA: hypothetical protein VMW01_02385 [Williamwhitmania sp.]|jgi:hypothetical protein|nr:hypothetical protein [Williamwhitmania sp.]